MRGRELYQIKAFCAIVEHGSFIQASAHLGLSASGLSQIIKDLETRLNLRLLNRTTRSISTTEAGQKIYDRAMPALQSLDTIDTLAAKVEGRVSGELRLNASRIAATIYLAPVLADFLKRYPDVAVDIRVDDRLVDVVADGFDAGIRLGEKLHQDMIAIPLSGDIRMKAVASPAYIERFGSPAHPNDLKSHRCLCFRNPSDSSVYRWEFERGNEQCEVTVTGPIVVDEPAMLPIIAAQGAGVAYQFSHQVDPLIASGALVQLLNDWTRPFPGFYIYYPSNLQMRSVFRAFLNHVHQSRG